MNVFQAILTGNVLPGFSVEIAGNNLAELMKIEKQHAIGLLQGSKKVIKRGIDQATAQKYAETVSKTGAECIAESELDFSDLSIELNLSAASSPIAHTISHQINNVLPTITQEIPDGIKGWSWAAFLWNWIWAIKYSIWFGLLALIPYVGFVVAIILGVRGRELAWKSKNWDSVEQFNLEQKKWVKWWFYLVGGLFVIGILAAIAIPAYQGYQKRALEVANNSASYQTPATANDAVVESEPARPQEVAPSISDSLFSDETVLTVKSGSMQMCPNHTVEQMVNGFMGNPEWESIISDDQKKYVNIKGDITFHDKPVRANIQFYVEGNSFTFNAFDMNGVPSANGIAVSLLEKMCASASN